ncbi:MAG: ABC transporter ATP-binding protein [Oscillospiraceae bacterium]|nr:ABC transporter ATP-binding protein [Oscillospiraceae bacterium]
MGILEVRGVSKSFDGRPILDRIDLTLNQGELVCLLGVSGGGKSTLFNIISGLLTPDSGQVLLDGHDVTGCPGHVSYMLQKDLLLPYRTVQDNVILPLLLQGIPRSEALKTAHSLFDAFGLDGTQRLYPTQLSGGMRQRAALLRTYLFSRKVVLLDEPFSALDALTKSAMHRWYLDVMDRMPVSTLFITHDVDEAILLSDRICLLSGTPGRITHQISVPYPRPRPDDFKLSQGFLACKKQILSLL